MIRNDLTATKVLRALLLAALLAVPASAANAQASYPSRTIKIVVPVPPGPILDTLPRIIAERLSASWGQPVIIENRPGAAQNLGAEVVAKSAPDGYTLLATPAGPLTISQHLFAKLGFDPTAFTPVSILVTIPAVLVVNPQVPASNLKELVAYAKANPGKLSYGTPGAGSSPHLATAMLLNATGIQAVHVPYKGMGPATTDLLAGHIDMMIDNLGNVWPHIKDGRLRLLAATTAARIPELPGVATIAETYPDVVYTSWFAIVAPPKTPPEIASKLSTAISEALKRPDVSERLREFSVTPLGSSPADTAALLERERERWRRVIVSIGIKAH
jgi:tripartite-type tricarboxylate transporter receptor subunit TctC